MYLSPVQGHQALRTVCRQSGVCVSRPQLLVLWVLTWSVHMFGRGLLDRVWWSVFCAQQEGPVSYPKLHLPLDTLQDLFYQQLHVELSSSVSVQSVEEAPVMTKEVIEAVRGSF